MGIRAEELCAEAAPDDVGAVAEGVAGAARSEPLAPLEPELLDCAFSSAARR